MSINVGDVFTDFSLRGKDEHFVVLEKIKEIEPITSCGQRYLVFYLDGIREKIVHGGYIRVLPRDKNRIRAERARKIIVKRSMHNVLEK